MESVKANTKELKDYLHLYIGCRMLLGEGAYVDLTPERYARHLRQLEDGKGLPIKLFLRPLSDITEEETQNAMLPMLFAMKVIEGEERLKQLAEIARFLISRDFDVFGLIEAGIALSKESK